MIKWGFKMSINAKEIHISAEFITAADKLKAIQERYPTYYKAWRSMLANRSADEITEEWRGVSGLVQFIDDTSKLTGAGITGVKLKRKNTMRAYSALNVYWALPKNKQKLVLLQLRNKELASSDASSNETVYKNLFSLVPPSEPEINTRLANIDVQYKTICELYQTYDERMERFNTLGTNFNLTEEEKIELDILNKLLFDIDLPIDTPPSKYEDI